MDFQPATPPRPDEPAQAPPSLATLKADHRRVVQYHLQGMGNAEIGVRLNMAASTVGAVLKAPMAQAYLARLMDSADEMAVEVRREISRLQLPAIRTIEELLTQEGVPASVKLAASKDILDRGGHKPAEKHQHLHQHMTRADIEELKRRAGRAIGEPARLGPAQNEPTLIGEPA